MLDQNEKKVCLPNFLIVGTQKSGTTSCHYYLKQHPEIFMSAIKEPHFVAEQFFKYPPTGLGSVKIFKNTIKDFDDYCKLYETAYGKKAVGESCADNLYYHEKAIPHIKHYFGDPKIIIILRNPVERAYSAYTERIRDNLEHLSFEDALEEEGKRISEGWYNGWFYRDVGFYFKPVQDYMRAFSRVKILLFDDLKQDTLSFMNEIYAFLDVDSSFVPDLKTIYNISGIPKYKRLNRFFIQPTKLQGITRRIGKFILKDDGWVRLRDTLRGKLLIKTDMNPETRRRLKEEYRDDLQKLAILTGHDLSHWYQ